MILSQENRHLCPYCLKRGLRNPIQPVQSNWKSAILFCSDPQCIYPLDKKVTIVASDWNKLANGEASVDKTVFDAAVEEIENTKEKSSENSKKQNTPACVVSPESSPNDLADCDMVHGIDNDIDDILGGDSIDDLFNDNGDDEFSNFLEYLSNLPNTSFSAFSELPTEKIQELYKRQGEIMKVMAPPVIVVGDSQPLAYLTSLMDQRDGLASLESLSNRKRTADGGIVLSIDKSEPRRYAQWREDSTKQNCWLTAGLCLIVHSRIIRCALKAVSQSGPKLADKSDRSSSTIIASVCSSYEMAMRKLLVALTLRNDNTVITSSQSSDSGSGFDTSKSNFEYLSFGEQYGVSIPKPLHLRIVDHLVSCQELVIKSMQDEKVLASHPADVIGYLLNSHDILRELSIVSYQFHLSCSSCNNKSIKFHASRAVTFEIPHSVSSFSLTGSDCCTQVKCHNCGSEEQSGQLSWHTFSPLLLLHFPNGLPNDCEFEKLRISADALNVSKETIAGCERYCITSKGKYEFRVSAIITSEQKSAVCGGSHYLTWVRRGNNDSWMACQEALGKGSYLVEWDPLTAPRTIGQPGRNVRVLFFEAVPVPRKEVVSLGPNRSSIGEIQGKSRLQQHFINIMRERRKQMRQPQGSNQTSTTPPTVMSTAVGSAMSIMQRFLNSEVEHQALIGGTSSRFQPYSRDINNSGSQLDKPSGQDIDDSLPLSHLLRRKNEAVSKDKEAKITGQNEAATSSNNLQTKSCARNVKEISSTKRMTRSSKKRYADISAVSLWPTRAKTVTAKSSPVTEDLPESNNNSQSSNSSSTPSVPATVSNPLVTFDLGSTTSFLEGHSSSLGNSERFGDGT